MELITQWKIQAAHNNAIHPAHRAGRDCLSVHITKDEMLNGTFSVDNRPQAQLIPSPIVRIVRNGEIVRYEVSVLVPDDFDAFDTDGNPARHAVFQFHEGGNTIGGITTAVKPPVAFALQVYGNKMRAKGHTNDGAWFTAFERYYVPEEWTDWRVDVKWSTEEDGWRKVYRNGQLIYSFQGNTCADIHKAPYWLIGLFRDNWDEAKIRPHYTRVFYSGIKMERISY